MPSIKDTLTAIVASHARAKEVLLCPDPSGDDCQRAIDALDKAVATPPAGLPARGLGALRGLRLPRDPRNRNSHILGKRSATFAAAQHNADPRGGVACPGTP